MFFHLNVEVVSKIWEDIWFHYFLNVIKDCHVIYNKDWRCPLLSCPMEPYTMSNGTLYHVRWNPIPLHTYGMMNMPLHIKLDQDFHHVAFLLLSIHHAYVNTSEILLQRFLIPLMSFSVQLQLVASLLKSQWQHPATKLYQSSISLNISKYQTRY